VPTAAFFPTDTVAHVRTFSGFCILYGYSVPFSEDTLQSPYWNHGDYVSQVAGESGRLLREGFWLHPDAVEVVNRAAAAPTICGCPTGPLQTSI
jgi:hypothetical protein